MNLNFIFFLLCIKFTLSFAGLACQIPPSIKKSISCNMDLTVAIDMSSAMGYDSNIAKLSNNILLFLSTIDYQNNSNTHIAGLTFGASTIDASRYFNNYAEICEFIHSAHQQSVQMGMAGANLSEVFRIYEISLLHTKRQNQKVLILFTAIEDKDAISSAKYYSRQLKSAGVKIIVIALNHFKANKLKGLGSVLYSSNNFGIPSHIRSSNFICPNTEHKPPQQRPTMLPSLPETTDPRPNVIGTPCSSNTNNAWLDIILAVDVSNAMSARDLQEFTGEIASLLTQFNIGQFGDHTTRVGIVTYGTDVVVRYSLNDVTNLTALNQQLMLLGSYANTSDYGINVQNALQVSYNLLKNQSSNRIPIILIVGAAYNTIGFNGAEQIANVIKDNGIKIIAMSFDASDGVLPAEFDLLASPGYSYISSQDGLYQSLLFGLTQVNCFCPQGKHQFQVYNEAFKNYTVYADCLWAITSDALPSFVQDYGCSNGIVAAITSQQKLDFISDKVISIDGIGKKQFTIGLHNKDNGWKWWGYDKSEYPLGDYPQFSASVGDIYGYLNNSFGLNWSFLSGGDISKPYLCELKACDTDYICKY